MKSYSAAQAREHMADILDAAEDGQTVLIDRRGVRFQLVAQPRKAAARVHRRILTIVDEAVDSGQWSWEGGKGALSFVGKKTRAS